MRHFFHLNSAACNPGFYGLHCDVKCPVGTFGEKCGGVCFPTCQNSACDNVLGCSRNTHAVTQTTGSFLTHLNNEMHSSTVYLEVTHT